MSRSVKPFLEGKVTDQRVGAKYVDGDCGPVADITTDRNWLHIETDPYEGHVMLHIETLPLLRKALARLARHLKAKAAAPPPSG